MLLKKIRLAVLLSSAVLCGCSEETANSQDFLFDTYSQLTVCGTDADNTLSALDGLLTEMSGEFALCYGTAAETLSETDLYSDCLERTRSLNAAFGDGINVRCGALTALWGISTPSPRVPSESEIADALKTVPSVNSDSSPEGMMYDFGAVSKGYACDRALELLKGTETRYAIVSLSSTTLLYGEKPGSTPFKTGITDPLTGEGYIGILNSDAAFISTSGGYERFFEADGERYCHILDMETGRPVQTDLVSVTVIIPADVPNGGIMSDFLATLIYIRGSTELDKWLSREDMGIIAADSSGMVRSSCKGFLLDESGEFFYGKK